MGQLSQVSLTVAHLICSYHMGSVMCVCVCVCVCGEREGGEIVCVCVRERERERERERATHSDRRVGAGWKKLFSLSPEQLLCLHCLLQAWEEVLILCWISQ